MDFVAKQHYTRIVKVSRFKKLPCVASLIFEMDEDECSIINHTGSAMKSPIERAPYDIIKNIYKAASIHKKTQNHYPVHPTQTIYGFEKLNKFQG